MGEAPRLVRESGSSTSLQSTDGQNQSSQSSVVTMQFYTDQAPTLVETYYASDVSKFHYMAFSHL